MSISLRTADQPGKDAVLPLLDWRNFDDDVTVVLPKKPRDIVSGDVSFRTPAVKILVVNMYTSAQRCHTKSAICRPIQRVSSRNVRRGPRRERLPYFSY